MGMLEASIGAFGTALRHSKVKMAGIVLFQDEPLLEELEFFDFIEIYLSEIDNEMSIFEKYYIETPTNIIIAEQVLKVKLEQINQLVIFNKSKLILSISLEDLYSKYQEYKQKL